MDLDTRRAIAMAIIGSVLSTGIVALATLLTL